MDESEEKQIRDEAKRPQVSLWTESKKDREGNDVITRVSTVMIIAPPRTPVASDELRKDVQAKDLAAEEGVAMSEEELLEESESEDEHEVKTKKKRGTGEEEEEDDRETAILQVERRERNHRRSGEARAIMEVSDEEEDSVDLPPQEEPLRSRAEWTKAWTAEFGCYPSGLSLFAMATLLPPCRGVTMKGHPRNRNILIVGDLGGNDLYCVAGHLLVLKQNGRRTLTRFSTKEEYRLRMEQGNPPSNKALILFVDPEEFMEGIRETTQALPDARDPAWQALWKEMRASLIFQFEPTLTPHPRNLLDATDISAGTGREDEGDEEAGNPGGGITWRGRGGSTSRRSDGRSIGQASGGKEARCGQHNSGRRWNGVATTTGRRNISKGRQHGHHHQQQWRPTTGEEGQARRLFTSFLWTYPAGAQRRTPTEQRGRCTDPRTSIAPSAAWPPQRKRRYHRRQSYSGWRVLTSMTTATLARPAPFTVKTRPTRR
jgi:hypothetical protein